jgi:hypothetical protein
MNYAPEFQADSTGERPGAAVSFATKEDAIAYIVSLAPRGTSLFDIPVKASIRQLHSRHSPLPADLRVRRHAPSVPPASADYHRRPSTAPMSSLQDRSPHNRLKRSKAAETEAKPPLAAASRPRDIAARKWRGRGSANLQPKLRRRERA